RNDDLNSAVEETSTSTSPDYVIVGRGPKTALDRRALDVPTLRQIISTQYDPLWSREYEHSPFAPDKPGECSPTRLATTNTFPSGYLEYSETITIVTRLCDATSR
ncbi:hypothetical protein GOEFS_031_00130, partial [Gordonia effusa NBRC 100432]